MIGVLPLTPTAGTLISFRSPSSPFSVLPLLRPTRIKSRRNVGDRGSEQLETSVSAPAAQVSSIGTILARVDEELSSGNDSIALAIISDAPGIRGFGAATQVPLGVYSISDLRLNNIDTTCFLSPVDSTLGEVRRNLQIAAALLGIGLWQTMGLSQLQVLVVLAVLTLISGIDMVANNGGMETLLIDSFGRILSEKYRNRVAQHEAGHFLVAYLLGILPKGYTLSSLEAFLKEGSFNVQAGTRFVDVQFQEEVKSGKLSFTVQALNKYSCIAIAGVATEYILFGRAEGGLSDIEQLDNLLKSLNFTQKKADSQVRWAVLNTVTILRRHIELISKLATAMSAGKSAGQCIQMIEEELAGRVEI